jgi:hypothetical protein
MNTKQKLNRELKALLLSILKSGNINQSDVSRIAELAGMEVETLQIEIIDKTEQVEKQ